MTKKLVINQMKIKVDSRPENENLIARTVLNFVEIYTFDKVAEDIMVAVKEAVTNCLEYAYLDKIGIIEVEMKIFEDGKIIIKIKDKGCGIENVELAMTPLFTTDEKNHAGIGFTVMEEQVDKLTVKSIVNGGTTVTLEKKIDIYE